jgi:hypothetical protein
MSPCGGCQLVPKDSSATRSTRDQHIWPKLDDTETCIPWYCHYLHMQSNEYAMNDVPYHLVH